jgi:thioredoxin-like negative regulator of GroEL
MIYPVTDEEFRKVLPGPGWIAVLFWTYQSIPCRHFKPEFQKFSDKTTTVFCAMLLVDEHPTILSELGVTVVPTTLLFKDGHEWARYEGPYTAEALSERVSQVMKKA